MRNAVQMCLALSVWLQLIFCSCVRETVLFSFLRSLLRENGRSLRFLRIFIKKKLGDRMIKQLLNSVIAKYLDLLVSRRSIICLSLRLRQIIDLLATDKSRYFVQPLPIIVKDSKCLMLHIKLIEYKEPNEENGLTGVVRMFCSSIYLNQQKNSA